MVSKIVSKTIALFVILAFTVTSVVVPDVFAGPMSPAASAMPFQPPMIQGMTLYPDQPLRFDFIVNGEWSMADKTNPHPPTTDPQQEYLKLIRYFLAGLAIPEETMWVNLSPSEPDRIIPETFGQTEMGQTLLAQDYILKKLTASLMNPDTETGKVMWEKIYAQAYAHGVTDIPVESLNKVWIVPGKTSVYENTSANSVFVVDHELDVMMEEDYLGNGERGIVDNNPPSTIHQSPATRQIIRDIIIPVIKEEVNHGESFAPLRQIMNSLILATWYKNALKDSVLTQGFADKAKLGGMASDHTAAKDKIYQQYLGLFRSGVADVIREDYDPVTQTIVPRKYFTGGVIPADFAMIEKAEPPTVAARFDTQSVVVQADFAMMNPVWIIVGVIAIFFIVGRSGDYVKNTFLSKPDSKPTGNALTAHDRLMQALKTNNLEGQKSIKATLEEYQETLPEMFDILAKVLIALLKDKSNKAQMAKKGKGENEKEGLSVFEVARAFGLIVVMTLEQIFKADKKGKKGGLPPSEQTKNLDDLAMLEKNIPGGIDVRKINVMVEKSGIGVTTAFEDPAMLQRLRNSTGLNPVIFGIETLQTPVFYKLLGLNADGTENHSDPAQPDSKTETAFIRQEQL